jgi:hypothetical protein
MRIKKKKSIKELSTKIEQFIVIVNTGRSKDNIHIDYIAYQALNGGLIIPTHSMMMMTFGG